MTRVPEPKTGYGDCFLCYRAKHRVYGFPIYDGHAMGPCTWEHYSTRLGLSAAHIADFFFFMRCDALKMF